MAPLSDDERHGFLEVCDDRYGRRSTVLTSQLPVESCHAQIGDPTNAGVPTDRSWSVGWNAGSRNSANGQPRRKQRGISRQYDKYYAASGGELDPEEIQLGTENDSLCC